MESGECSEDTSEEVLWLDNPDPHIAPRPPLTNAERAELARMVRM
jgi:hypothetical protein